MDDLLEINLKIILPIRLIDLIIQYHYKFYNKQVELEEKVIKYITPTKNNIALVDESNKVKIYSSKGELLKKLHSGDTFIPKMLVTTAKQGVAFIGDDTLHIWQDLIYVGYDIPTWEYKKWYTINLMRFNLFGELSHLRVTDKITIFDQKRSGDVVRFVDGTFHFPESFSCPKTNNLFYLSEDEVALSYQREIKFYTLGKRENKEYYSLKIENGEMVTLLDKVAIILRREMGEIIYHDLEQKKNLDIVKTHLFIKQFLSLKEGFVLLVLEKQSESNILEMWNLITKKREMFFEVLNCFCREVEAIGQLPNGNIVSFWGRTLVIHSITTGKILASMTVDIDPKFPLRVCLLENGAIVVHGSDGPGYIIF